MANLGLFDANQVKPSEARGGPIPAGEYPAIITDSKEGRSKAGHPFIELTFQVIDGPHKGALLWHYLNMQHPNAQTVEIARAQLSSICHAIGRLQVTDTQQLHNCPHTIRVTFQKADPSKGREQDGNRIVEWKSRSAPAANRAPASGAPAPAWQQPPAAQQQFPQQPAAQPQGQSGYGPPQDQQQNYAPAPASAPPAGGSAPWHRNAA